MQSITNCPACQTQFVVTELQLQQHNGTVRCGHCLHVFNATEQLVKLVNTDVVVVVEDAVLENTNLEIAVLKSTDLETNDLETNDLETKGLENTDLENKVLESNILESNVIQLKPRIKPDLTPTDLLSPSELISQTSTDNHLHDVPATVTEMATAAAEILEAISDVASNVTHDDVPQDMPLVTPINLAASNITHTAETHQYDYLTEPSKPKSNSKLPPVFLWIFLITLVLSAIAQSVYFLRHQIALYYPNIKPSLVQVCKEIGCSIDLPKKIEFIVIDDSDIQEDAEHAGLMRLSTTLINQADFHQAYPNLELTLTDIEDKPKLRRIFKPQEYLPVNTNIAKGLAAGEELKVKLAMTTQGIDVAGYRVFVTY